MRSKYVTYLLFMLGLFLLITVFRRWIGIEYLLFWFGGLIGVFLPDIDQLIYVYALRPHELSSQRAAKIIAKGNVKHAVGFLRVTSQERGKLVFHTILFQLLFATFAFLVVSSSGSLLGTGLVLGFLLHLLIDQIIDLMDDDDLDVWFVHVKAKLSKQQATLYWFGHLALLLILSFLF